MIQQALALRFRTSSSMLLAQTCPTATKLKPSTISPTHLKPDYFWPDHTDSIKRNANKVHIMSGEFWALPFQQCHQRLQTDQGWPGQLDGLQIELLPSHLRRHSLHWRSHLLLRTWHCQRHHQQLTWQSRQHRLWRPGPMKTDQALEESQTRLLYTVENSEEAHQL